jgi:hypothetical protein
VRSIVASVVAAKMHAVYDAVGEALAETRFQIEAQFMQKFEAAAKRDAESTAMLERLAVLLEQVQKLGLLESGQDGSRH